MSWRGVVLLGSCPNGILSWCGTVLVLICGIAAVVLVGNCPSGESSCGELSVWDLVADEISSWGWNLSWYNISNQNCKVWSDLPWGCGLVSRGRVGGAAWKVLRGWWGVEQPSASPGHWRHSGRGSLSGTSLALMYQTKNTNKQLAILLPQYQWSFCHFLILVTFYIVSKYSTWRWSQMCMVEI